MLYGIKCSFLVIITHECASITLLTIDFKKAFDSLEWNFMLKTLQTFNFGPSFINWIKTIYNSPEACIENNGHISEVFQISRGIRQGCPVSALLNVLSVEVLATKIRQSQSLKGFNFGTEENPIKLAQYADDAILFLNDKEELCSAINIINHLGSLQEVCSILENVKDYDLERTSIINQVVQCLV